MAAKPLLLWAGNVIDFTYCEESCQLSCIIQHSKILVSSAVVATSRTSRADVIDQPVGGGGGHMLEEVLIKIRSKLQ
jgi:hypothetical protein